MSLKEFDHRNWIRIMIAIIENNQQKDGTIKVPDVLVPYMGKKFIGK